MEVHIIGPDPVVQEPHRSVPLEHLAHQVRAGLELARRERCNALHHDLAVGDALLEAQARVSTGWKRWLRENCFLSVRTALLYQQLARHRAEIEAEIERVGELSLRAAVRLLAKPKSESETSKPEKPNPVARAVANLRALSDVQLTAVWTVYGLTPFLRTISADMRSELERRIAGLRSHTKGDGPVLLRESEVLRFALSQVRIAVMSETTPANSKLAEEQALQALRALARTLADVDTDCVTLINSYAKEKRCAKTKKVRRAA
jgi:hypothetical protein